jgi:ZIP family zinc transporter
MNFVVFMALIATLGTWFVTALGAATVVFFKSPNQKVLNLMLGFASGVMIAASFWSLLQPAIERAKVSLDIPAYLVATIGFLFGALFIWISDKTVNLARKRAEVSRRKSNERLRRIIMLVLSITLHNIPEGLAVGVAFGGVAAGIPSASIGAAITLALGIGLQNFPEGAAVSLPLRRDGLSVGKSFIYGQFSGLVEPIAGVLGVLAAMTVRSILPFLLAFSAGAMIAVVGAELLPEASIENKNLTTIGLILGFITMMVLDVALG